MTSSGKPTQLDPILPALWNAQMYKQSKGAYGKAAVRLPNVDERLPLEKCASELEVAPESDQQSSYTPPWSSASSSSSFEQNQQSIESSSRNREQNANESPRNLFPRGSRGRGDHRNKGIKAVKLRYQQEKIARQQAVEAAYITSGGTVQSNIATSDPVGPPTSMYSFSSTSWARRKGPQPVVRLPQQQSFEPHRMESTSNNSHSPLVPQHPLPHERVDNIPNPLSSYGRSDNTLQRSPLRPCYSQRPSNQAGAYRRPNHNDWNRWAELSVKVFDLPPTTTTRDLYQCFSREGNVVMIELYENARGEREGKGVVRFKYVLFAGVHSKTLQ